MNIQIFGTKKSFDTKKAQRYFKERRIKFQFIDLKEKEMSKGELQSVMRAVGGIDVVIDPGAKDQDAVALITYLAESQKFDKLLENQQVLREPIVRNGAKATVGYCPDVWRPVGASAREWFCQIQKKCDRRPLLGAPFCRMGMRKRKNERPCDAWLG